MFRIPLGGVIPEFISDLKDIGITNIADGQILVYNATSGKFVNKPVGPVPSANGNFAGLDANGNIIDSGKKAADFAEATEIINENLLKNAYFIGGGSQQGGGQFPINDTGRTSYNDGGYSTINGWSLSGLPNNTELEIVSDGIIITHPNTAGTYSLLQNVDNYQQFLGKTLTMSFLGSLLEGSSCEIVAWYHPNTQNYDGSYNVTSFEDGLATATFTVPSDATGLCILVSTNGGNNPYKLKLKAAKLELGSKQTLARKVNNTWVLNSPPPNFALELAKCNASSWETYGRKGNIVSQADMTSLIFANTNTSGRTLYVGEYIYTQNQFCRVTTQIADNASIIISPATGYNCVPTSVGDELKAESSFTDIGSGLKFRLLGDGLVQWQSSGYNASITASTEFTYPVTLPDKYTPKITASDTVCIYSGSGYLTGDSTNIYFQSNKSIILAAVNVSGIGVAGGGIYSIK